MTHRGRVTLQSVDLDTDAGASAPLDGDYDAGWPGAAPSLWSAKGPSVHAPRLGLFPSLRLHARWMRSGVRDAARLQRALNIVRISPAVRLGLIKGAALSGVVCALVYFSSVSLHLPTLYRADRAWDTDGGTVWVGSVSSVFWLYPVIAGTYLLAATWTTGVAEAAFSAQHASAATAQETLAGSFIDNAARVALITNYSVVCFLLQAVPWIGPPLAFVAMCLADGYFCFEQAWSRLRFCESHWSYMIGFGLPSTAISYFHPSGLFNLMLFMLGTPSDACTLLALLADPQPHGAAVGTQTAVLPSAPAADRSTPLCAWFPARIPFFWPTAKFRQWLQRSLGRPAARLGADPMQRGAPAPRAVSTPRRSAAQFVDAHAGSVPGWTPSPRSTSTAWPSSVSIPMADALGPRKIRKDV
ncbi:hypothetical protein MSPP1_003483 [Malassezia sp. CBS 17886]|nr:hypothetical protein MSPP1_003483 [Malassezia sp. CBS 17886]